MNFTTYVGDSLRLVCSVKSRLDTSDPLVITGTTITFVLNAVAGVPPSPVTITKAVGTGVTITDGPNGIFSVDLSPTDMNTFGAGGGTFSYYARVQIDPTHVHTVAVGQIKVLPLP